MHRTFRILLCLFVALVAPQARAALAVVTTTPDLAAVARAVGGKRVTVRSLALPSQDPHWVDARPNLAVELGKAELLIVAGSDLEVGWLPTLQLGSRNGAIQKGARGFLDCSELVTLLDVPAGKVDRSMGDIHPGGSPHYMFDPRAAERVAVGIGKRMAELDPEGREVYLAQTKQFLAALRLARKGWEKKLAAMRGREVIAFHRSLGYLADWLGFSVLDHVEPKPGIPPNPHHVADLIQRAKQHKVRALVQESWHPTSTSEQIARAIGAKLVKLPGSTNYQGGQSYVAFMNEVVRRLGAAL